MISKVVGFIGIAMGAIFISVTLFMNKSGMLSFSSGIKAALFGIFTYCAISGILLLQ